ncbi:MULTISPECIES: DegV family protein [unclassified Leptotrichia]|jgi:DAK2 domain fusion protein yloV|uniref:DegV family protein n=1 Tax=unclassified Leptotrichia TaxID=2633022 RepID=UPI0003AE38A3|nr:MULTISPECIES: DegV family protein [unclassified Leptotrichia]ERL25886.1 DAK2 domain fusion protein YloV [Leptotrichia sp. oral taxon 225 str. F0581]WLD74292.1 DegV family protein [Leptotrichia sp. HMT-225]
MAIKYLDAKRLKLVFIGGGKWVTKHEDLLNELNVYPVPDGDTGSNMSMTLNSMINDLEEKTDDKIKMPQLVEVVEEAVLMGARGNSGTILSQVITGFLKGIGDKVKLLPKDVAEALLSAKETAYSAVSEPIEGTILTVIRKISEKATECADKFEDLVEFLREIVKAGEQAVEETPELLPKLKEAGVVDAGGKGLFFFFEGFYKVTTELNLLVELQKAQVKENEFDKTIANIDHDPESIHFQYCTEYIILNGDFDTEEYKKRVLELGDSAVFAQTSKKFKTHIHTNHPGKAMEIALEYGPLEKMKIENMKLQHDNLQIFSERDEAKIFVNPKIDKTKSAFVILADSENLKDEFLKIGADVVILGGQSKNPSVQEILNAIDKTEKENVYVLPNNKNVITTAKMAAEKSQKTVMVLDTKTMLDGYYFLKHKENDIDEVKEAAARNYSVEITKAVRDTKVEELTIAKNDFIGLVNGKIKYAKKSLKDITDAILADLVTKNTITAIIVSGNEKDENSQKNIEEKLSGIKTSIIDGNQENYYYYLYIENKDPNMPEIAILTDSVSDLTYEDIEGLPIKIVPLKIDINGELYRDGIEITKPEFWHEMLDNDATIKTSQPSPQDFLNAYNKLFEKGYKKIISIHPSSKLSGTIQAAKVGRSLTNRENDIELIDSMGASLLQGFLVLGAAGKSVRGESFTEIINWVNNFRTKGKLLMIIPDLKYLEKGGRIGKASSTIAGALNMKPILTVNQGEVTVEKKVLGERNAQKYIEKYIERESKKQSIVLMTGWGGTPTELENVVRIYSEVENNPKINSLILNREIGAVIGAHAGPVYGVFIFPRLS